LRRERGESTDFQKSDLFTKADNLQKGERHESKTVYLPHGADFFVHFFSVNQRSVEQSRMLIIVPGKQPTRTAETLLAKQLIRANYKVVTSDELTPSSRFTTEDILEARRGNLTKTRKVASFYDANIILKARIQTQVISVEILCMKTNKAITIISYKVPDTASGNILDMNSLEYLGVSKSPIEAKHTQKELKLREVRSLEIRMKTDSFLINKNLTKK